MPCAFPTDMMRRTPSNHGLHTDSKLKSLRQTPDACAPCAGCEAVCGQRDGARHPHRRRAGRDAAHRLAQCHLRRRGDAHSDGQQVVLGLVHAHPGVPQSLPGFRSLAWIIGGLMYTLGREHCTHLGPGWGPETAARLCMAQIWAQLCGRMTVPVAVGKCL